MGEATNTFTGMQGHEMVYERDLVVVPIHSPRENT